MRRSGVLHVGLMAVAVGDDQRASLVNQIVCGILAVLRLADGILPDDLIRTDAQTLGCFVDTVDVSLGVAFVLISDQNDSDLQIGCGSGGSGLRSSSSGLRSGSCGGRAAPAAEQADG